MDHRHNIADSDGTDEENGLVSSMKHLFNAKFGRVQPLWRPNESLSTRRSKQVKAGQTTFMKRSAGLRPGSLAEIPQKFAPFGRIVADVKSKACRFEWTDRRDELCESPFGRASLSNPLPSPVTERSHEIACKSNRIQVNPTKNLLSVRLSRSRQVKVGQTTFMKRSAGLRPGSLAEIPQKFTPFGRIVADVKSKACRFEWTDRRDELCESPFGRASLSNPLPSPAGDHSHEIARKSKGIQPNPSKSNHNLLGGPVKAS